MDISVKEFNSQHPVGTKVLYFPIYGRQQCKEATTTSQARIMCGMPMVGLSIGGGGYAIRNIEIAPEPEQKEWSSEMRDDEARDFERQAEQDQEMMGCY